MGEGYGGGVMGEGYGGRVLGRGDGGKGMGKGRAGKRYLRRSGSDRGSQGAVVGAGAAAVQGRDAGGEGLRHELRADEVHVRVEAARRHDELLT